MKIAKLFCISILLGSCGASTPMKAVDPDMLAAVTLHLTLPATWAYMWYQDIKNQQRNSMQTPEPTAPTEPTVQNIQPIAPTVHEKETSLVKALLAPPFSVVSTAGLIMIFQPIAPTVHEKETSLVKALLASPFSVVSTAGLIMIFAPKIFKKQVNQGPKTKPLNTIRLNG